MKQIRRFGVAQTAKVAGVLYLVIGVVFGVGSFVFGSFLGTRGMLGGGIFGYPKAAGCRVIAEEAKSHLEAVGHSVTTLRLVAIDEETVSHLLDAAGSLC